MELAALPIAASSPVADTVRPARAPGEVGAFGDAAPLGGPGARLAKPLAGIASTPTGHGYWLAGADGGIFSFGDAAYHGSTGKNHLAAPIVGIAPTPTGHGYWLAGADGGIFSFGAAAYHGSSAGGPAGTKAIGIAATPSGRGYWVPTASNPQPAGAAYAVSVSGPAGRPIGTFLVTCYDINGTTASGAHTSTLTVAVDPSVIPLGSHIYVDGAGPRIAQDTGGAIVGRRLDIWAPSYAQCAAWGAQDRQVWLQG
jgi:3D (Asp-Asp-Asp) domain-containing protein